MKTALQYKLLQQLRQRQKNAGFTLIELLVVVIIVGILAAVALPNLLSQVGKARETEFKNAVGTINRAQQSYHFERQTFADGTGTNDPEKVLGVTIPRQYIDPGIASLQVTGNATDATVAPLNAEFAKDGTRAYSGGINFAAATGVYTQIVCQSNENVDKLAAPTGGNTCPTGVSVQVK